MKIHVYKTHLYCKVLFSKRIANLHRRISAIPEVYISTSENVTFPSYPVTLE